MSLLLAVRAHAEDFPPRTLTLAVSVDAIQPIDLPIVLRIKITNAGPEPFRYWCGGPGRYPDASCFPAQLKGSTGLAQSIQLENGQYKAGSGGSPTIDPKGTADMPAFLGPLAAGDYELIIRNGNPVRLTVRNDDNLRRSAEATWLAGLRKREPFYQQMLVAHEDDALIAALLGDLQANDGMAALSAAETLYFLHYPLPANADAQMAKAVTEQLAAPHPVGASSFDQRELFGYLGLDLAKFKTDVALQAELEMAHSRVLDVYAAGSNNQDNQLRAGIVRQMGDFPQPEALRQLRDFLHDPDGMVGAWAAQALAAKRDPVAYEYLVNLAKDPPLENAHDLFEAIEKYPADSRIEDALRQATKAKNVQVRQLAREALRAELGKKSAGK